MMFFFFEAVAFHFPRIVACHEYEENSSEQVKISVALKGILLLRRLSCYVFRQEKQKQPGRPS